MKRIVRCSLADLCVAGCADYPPTSGRAFGTRPHFIDHDCPHAFPHEYEREGCYEDEGPESLKKYPLAGCFAIINHYPEGIMEKDYGPDVPDTQATHACCSSIGGKHGKKNG